MVFVLLVYSYILGWLSCQAYFKIRERRAMKKLDHIEQLLMSKILSK